MSTPAPRWQVRATRPIAYDVVKTPALFAPQSTALLDYGRRGGRRFVVLDGNVMRLHGAAIRAWFMAHGIEARIVAVPGGEAHKTIETWQELARQLDAFPIHRRDEPIIAIGGGVLTDVVAFLAGSYRRGLPHIKVPTTLMGYIDAALGIKAGINFNGHKNRLGSFTPPEAVLLDPGFLRTLPYRHVRNGVCEIVKLALVCDAGLFTLLEASGARAIATGFAEAEGEAILDRAIDGMLAELAPNLHEEELSRKVDFGHTFSYGLEARHPEQLLHGEAVLLDCQVSVLIAQRRGLLDAVSVERIFALVERLSLAPDHALLDAGAMWQALRDRIEHRNGLQRVPLPVGIGDCRFVHDITRGELDAALRALRARPKACHELVRER